VYKRQVGIVGRHLPRDQDEVLNQRTLLNNDLLYGSQLTMRCQCQGPPQQGT